jgi:prepilin-type N-terminal cleavage/methylation domain-containing protein
MKIINKLQGFTLVEMAIVLAIIGLLIGSLLAPTSTQLTQQKITETEKRLASIREALLGFVIEKGYLPCPDIDSDGKEDRKNDNVCDYDETDGYLPWADLGVFQFDAWGRPFRYRVDGFFSNLPSGNTIGLLQIRNKNPLQITDQIGNKLNKATDAGERSNIVALIFSCGKNGRPDDGNANGTIVSANCENGEMNKHEYVKGMYVENQFDDILVVLPKTLFFSRLVAAGKWQEPD